MGQTDKNTNRQPDKHTNRQSAECPIWWELDNCGHLQNVYFGRNFCGRKAVKRIPSVAL